MDFLDVLDRLERKVAESDDTELKMLVLEYSLAVLEILREYRILLSTIGDMETVGVEGEGEVHRFVRVDRCPREET